MKNRFQFKIFCLGMLLISFAQIKSQDKKIDPNRMKDWIINEKVKIPFENIYNQEQLKKLKNPDNFKCGQKSITDANYYSSIIVDKNGKVIVSWYDQRENPKNMLTNYYIAESIDGGNSFTTNTKVSTAATDFATIGSQNY